ncbi:histidine-rich glycoprotein-like [Phlebotomus argentipes]|uniref:histidine-rich glycoprotein-like n=1 Tax=Phlebotomus argentipes TaxID=94469 RepID=UPI002893541D|nr:histidine-rich glycoprotein-like [Phlebotomus argentipes]
MKCLVVALMAIAVVQANVIITSQFHAQDGHHGYSYGYNNENNEKEESASHDRVKGAYKVSDKHGAFHSEVKYDVPQEHHDHHEHQQNHGFGHHHHHHQEHAKPFSYSIVAEHPKQHRHEHHEHHEHHNLHHQQNHFNFHHQHKRSLWHHNNDHQQHLSHNEVFHHEPTHHYGQEEHQHRWTGPVHVPVIKNGVPTESPEVQAARKEHEHKLAEAHQHASHAGHHYSHDYSGHNDHQYNYESKYSSKVHHHEQPKWHGPLHHPVIKHGVPTETPEVRHAKAHLLSKHAEAEHHSGHSDHSDYHHGHDYSHDEHQHHGHDYSHDEHQHQHQHQRWTGPVHVPVIEHGVPTETPEVRHAKAHHNAKHAQAHHNGHYAEQYNHQARWTGPIHEPVIVHGVPTETPEVRHAKAHLASKHAAHGSSWGQEEYAHDYHHAGEHRWTGPVHVPVIKHGVPTETPEVRHAKAQLLQKHAEAKSHPDYDKDCDKSQESHEVGWYQAHKHY